MRKNASNDARAGACADGDAEKTAKNAASEARYATDGNTKNAERTPLEKKKRTIIDRMQKLGVYRPQYMAAINRTAELYVELDRLMERYEESGYEAIVEHTNKAGATNQVKNPIRCAIDDAYSQLLAHERELGLTPSAMKKLGESTGKTVKESPLEAALRRLGG